MAPSDNPFAAVLLALDHMKDRNESDRHERLAFEAELRASANNMNARLQMLEATMLETSHRLAHVEPVVTMVTSVQAKMTGAALVIGIVGGVAWSGVLFFKERLIALLQ